MRTQNGKFGSLKKSQKEAVGLLCIGTFLEYFDLFLYIHMAIFLNELFFPTTDPRTGELLAAFAFCSTYVFRPIGALIFGYIGDTFGRKSTVIITTSIMALSCVLMANLPTYAQVGITAAYLVTIVRMLQGMASMGEVIGAEIYVTEITRPPIQYPAVAMIAVFGVLGGTTALGVATLVTTIEANWRGAFWFGATVASIGIVARTRLREAKDFAQATHKIKKDIHARELRNAKVNKITALSLFCIQCSWPVCFYFAYMYCGNILQNSFGYSSKEVIQQNFVVSMAQLLSWLLLAFLSYRINPLTIVRVRLIIFVIFLLFSPFIFNYMNSAYQVLLVQLIVVIFGFMGTPAIPIFYKHLPIFKRFTYASFTYALSRAVMYVVTSFGLVYLASVFGHWVMLATMLPVAIIFSYSIKHFVKLEKQA